MLVHYKHRVKIRERVRVRELFCCSMFLVDCVRWIFDWPLRFMFSQSGQYSTSMYISSIHHYYLPYLNSLPFYSYLFYTAHPYFLWSSLTDIAIHTQVHHLFVIWFFSPGTSFSLSFYYVTKTYMLFINNSSNQCTRINTFYTTFTKTWSQL